MHLWANSVHHTNMGLDDRVETNAMQTSLIICQLNGATGHPCSRSRLEPGSLTVSVWTIASLLCIRKAVKAQELPVSVPVSDYGTSMRDVTVESQSRGMVTFPGWWKQALSGQLLSRGFHHVSKSQRLLKRQWIKKSQQSWTKVTQWNTSHLIENIFERAANVGKSVLFYQSRNVASNQNRTGNC